MGWDLKGIIGSAIAGAADAGSKYFVEERRKETELAAQKDLADYKNEIELNRQQRLQEMKDAKEARDLMSNRESNATNEELAGEFAKEQGHKPGTVGWYDAKGDFLDRSGREDLAKNAYAQADKIRADDTKDQIAAARAAARAGGGGGGGGGKGSSGGAGEVDIEKELTGISKIGVSSKDGEAKADPAALSVANAFYSNALGALKDPKLALDATRKMMVRTTEYALDNNMSLREASKAVGTDMKNKFNEDVAKKEAKRQQGILQYPEEAPATEDATERNLNYLRNQGAPAQSAAKPKLPWWDPRSE